MKNIKIIGFDLDQTLYPKSPEIDDAIQQYIIKKITERFGYEFTYAQEKFKKQYELHGSGTKALIILGFQELEARDIVQTSLEKANITSYLTPNTKTIKLLQKLKHTYTHLALITGSNRELTLKKLHMLSIPTKLFELIITGERSKLNGDAYNDWLTYYTTKYPTLRPENFLYIGDRKTIDSDIPAKLGITTILVNVQKKDLDVTVPQLSSLYDLPALLC